MSSSWRLDVARMTVATVVVGVLGALAGLVVIAFLQAIELVVFGFRPGSGQEAADEPSALVRILALVVGGAIAGTLWWLVRRPGAPLVSPPDAVRGARMPLVRTLLDVAAQVLAVGLGASVGKEGAPRELGALLSSILGRRIGFAPRQLAVLVACGTGSGLAAVYDVPLGGALFVVEVMLVDLSVATAVPAIASCAIAAELVQLVHPTGPVYRIVDPQLSPSLVVGALLLGPLMGLGGTGFVTLNAAVGRRGPRGWRLIPLITAAFAAIGVLAIWFPELLGNGKALAQLMFGAPPPRVDAFGMPLLVLLVVLALLKATTTTLSFGAGAKGGTLMPSTAIGASAGAAFGAAWMLLWPGSTLSAFALVGASAFLAVTMRAPLTAVVLLVEFTGAGVPVVIIPSLLAVAGAVGVRRLIEHHPRIRME